MIVTPVPNRTKFYPERAIKFDSLLHDPPIYWFNQRNNSHCIRREIGGQTPEPSVNKNRQKRNLLLTLWPSSRKSKDSQNIYQELSKIQRNFRYSGIANFSSKILTRYSTWFNSQESCQNVERLRENQNSRRFQKIRKKDGELPRFRNFRYSGIANSRDIKIGANFKFFIQFFTIHEVFSKFSIVFGSILHPNRGKLVEKLRA